MILYWLILVALGLALYASLTGIPYALAAGSDWWLRFHRRTATVVSGLLIAHVVIGAPVALSL